jgi:hypothetical protein
MYRAWHKGQPMIPQIPPEIRNGTFRDTASGLIVPAYYKSNASSVEVVERGGLDGRSLQAGIELNRDKDTQVVMFPRKGSGLDDIVMMAIATGEIANVGVSPVIQPQLSALLVKQQHQAASATIELGGRESPVRKARDAIARFNDSPLGATDAMMQAVFQLRSMNRGAPIATVPITYDMGVWEQYGMTPMPILSERGKETGRYWLQTDWSKIKTPIPFLPNPLELHPTGNAAYPYWYIAKKDKQRIPVLLHQTQILSLTAGRSTMPGIGTSAVWLCLGWLAEDILVVDERLERLVNAVSAGIIGIGGIDQTADAVKSRLVKDAELNKEAGNLNAKAFTMLTSPTKEIKFTTLRFRESDGIEYLQRQQNKEDILALCFEVPLSEVVLRGGVGYGAQSDTAAEVNADTGVGSMLRLIGVALGSIYPRVQVTIKRDNDRSQRLNIGTLNTFSEAVARIPNVITAEEQRAIINRDILDIPKVEPGEAAVTGTNDDNDENKIADATTEGKTVEEKEPNPQQEIEAALKWASQLLAFTPVTPEDATAPLPTLEPSPEDEDAEAWDNLHRGEDLEGMLDAKPVENTNKIQNSVADWWWLLDSLAYLYVIKLRRRVDRADALELRDDFTLRYTPTVETLATLLASGAMGLPVWNRLMKQRTQSAYTTQHWLGRGGRQSMTEADYAWLRVQLQTQFDMLDDLSKRIAAGLYSEGQIANYSRGFINGSTAAYEYGNASAYGLPLLPQYPGDGKTECRQGCKCHLEIVPQSGDGNFAVYWRLGTAEHCGDCLRLAASWNPLRIRAGVIQ